MNFGRWNSWDPSSRFWVKVDLSGECWIFGGYCDVAGYGSFYVSVGYGGGPVRAHRFAWEDCVGPIPKGMRVLHRCDNPPCVNPRHLWLGTDADNMRDMSEKGRQGRPNAKKTHCPQGHPYDDANTIVRRNGWRKCRTCHNEDLRRRRQLS